MLADLNGYGYDDGFTTVIEWIGLVLLFSILAVVVFGWIRGGLGGLYDS